MTEAPSKSGAPGDRPVPSDGPPTGAGQPFAPPTPGDRPTPPPAPADAPWQEDPDATRPDVIPARPRDHHDAQWRPGAGDDDAPTTALPSGAADPDGRSWQHDSDATVVLPVARSSPRAAVDDERTMVMDRTAAPATGWSHTDTAEVPPVPNRRAGHEAPGSRSTGRYNRTGEYDVGEARRGARRAFRLRVLLVLSVLALGATVTGVLSTAVEIGGSGTDLDGIWKVNDLGTNNAGAAIAAASVMVVGAFLWCFGFKWGAGLAGGAGGALAGWAALLIGLIEWRPIADARLVADGVDVTRNIGYWAVAAAGGLGVLALLVSFAGSGRDRQGGLDPWIAALGAASFLVAAGGPLIPLGTADPSGNYNSDSLAVDFPTAFFVGRLVQLGLLGLCGVLGFLLVRRFGLGFAVGGAVAAAWMVVTAATEQTPNPIGLGFTNPGAAGGQLPHGVTIVGMALAGFFALVAIVMALLDND